MQTQQTATSENELTLEDLLEIEGIVVRTQEAAAQLRAAVVE